MISVTPYTQQSEADDKEGIRKMTGKTKGEWPYHEDRHGNWVACSSNPCKLHSGGDIMASSPEDAFAKADRMAHPQGGDGLTGADAVKSDDRGAEAVRKLMEDRRNREAKVRENMKSFYKEPVADPPADMKKTWNNRLDIGGKYLETQSLPRGKVASLIRKDITMLKKAGGVPKDWKMKVTTDANSYHDDFHITIIRPAGTTPIYRPLRPTDVYDPNNDGDGYRDYQEELAKEVGTSDYTYDQAVEYCKRHPEHRLYSDEYLESEKHLQDVANQYGMFGVAVNDGVVSKTRKHNGNVSSSPIDEEEQGTSGN